MLSIIEVLYPQYSFIFLFDNTTNHLVYVKDALHIPKMNKSIKSK